LLDDRFSLPWQLRLSVQLLAAVAADWFGFAPESWLLGVGMVLWIVGMTNAFNMLDNMDLLSAGTAWLAAIGLVVIYAMRPSDSAGLGFCWPLVGALTGFLWFNCPPARIFMGDVGSTFLGYFLSVATLDVVWPVAEPTDLLVPLFLLAVPCYDMISVVLIRLRQGRSPFHADKQHLSHRLTRLGLSRPAAVAVIHGLALLSVLAAVLLARTTSTAERTGVVATFVIGWCAFIAIDTIVIMRRPPEESP
jgi:UDP-GlcNAc:undecaprenyl-phosphate GlcNAc-1-phosphate transferase